jgi:hypothetical protein
MPTQTGLPRKGEIWERNIKWPGAAKNPEPLQVVILERTRGDYWSLRVHIPGEGEKLWVDPAYWFAKGEFTYIGPAGPETLKKLGL